MTEYRPDARCPNCGRRPAIDIPEDERQRASALPQNRVMCHVICRRCPTRYAILARDYRNACIVAGTKAVDQVRHGP